MALIHNLGFPRIGGNRELKTALESYWKGKSSEQQLHSTAKQLMSQNWHSQSNLDYIPIGDFSLYDNVLDMSFTLGHIPKKICNLSQSELERYFLLARGRNVNGEHCLCSDAAEMKKWFDTNYHYIVPELHSKSLFELNSERIISQLRAFNSLQLNHSNNTQAKPKIVLIGPVTYLWLCKSSGQYNRLNALDRLLAVYDELLQQLIKEGVEWIQFDEPALVTELDEAWQASFIKAYEQLSANNIRILLTTYFGRLDENLSLVCKLPVDGLHIDAVAARETVHQVAKCWPIERVLSVGIIDGRNIWRTDLADAKELLEPIAEQRGDNLWLAPSCSLLHVPIDLNKEDQLDKNIKQWFAFALQKIEELKLLKALLNANYQANYSSQANNSSQRKEDTQTIHKQFELHQKAVESRKNSPLIHSLDVQQMLKYITGDMSKRQNDYPTRATLQRQKLNLPIYPTTTIGSFPQTGYIRQIRSDWKAGNIDEVRYTQVMQEEIKRVIREQELIGLDVLVHGEAERNDMVEYFAEHLAGFVVTRFGWVQSYGSRCVKPPIIFGDVKRTYPITVPWSKYAQALTKKPVKGMLTGPVTMLNWSFVRNDQPLEVTCQQLALAIRSEVLALESAGIKIIQIDEAALREGLPLRRAEWPEYLKWAIDAFRLTSSCVRDETQIHTHMCYSEFSDIMPAIIQMDADVITIETTRSNMELLKSFCEYDYPNEIGPGIYDIHSPNVPNTNVLISRLRKAARYIPAERLWVNPDCGLKTRQWKEVIPALNNLVEVVKQLREEHIEATEQLSDFVT